MATGRRARMRSAASSVLVSPSTDIVQRVRSGMDHHRRRGTMPPSRLDPANFRGQLYGDFLSAGPSSFDIDGYLPFNHSPSIRVFFGGDLEEVEATESWWTHEISERTFGYQSPLITSLQIETWRSTRRGGVGC
ncbi:hypothetical protein NL676_013596 [Syzygium grande]|nr:hypothetical protein NL676_013596 [Syzygium grande]